MYIIVYALLYPFILCKANPNIKAILLDMLIAIMQTHVVNGTEKYIVNGNFINMHKKHLEKSIKLLKYNLEIQNKKV